MLSMQSSVVLACFRMFKLDRKIRCLSTPLHNMNERPVWSIMFCFPLCQQKLTDVCNYYRL